MGLNIDQTDFSPAQFSQFRRQLDTDLEVLANLLRQPGFGVGPASFGAELELYLVRPEGRPACLNRELQQALRDPAFTLELNRYNLEYNASPTAAAGTPFATLRRELDDALARVRRQAGEHGADCVAIGILPTLAAGDFGDHVMTDEKRYQALTASLRRLRHGSPFEIHIHGEEQVQFTADHVTCEGANTSFQFHYRVNPVEFAATWNALQLLAPVIVAAGANSPLFLGRKLWHETRIPLFKQSVDNRVHEHDWHLPSRVSFGHGWLRHSAWELFAEAVRLYEPLLPVSAPATATEPGAAPKLHALRLHEGTTWYWNRPVYDHHDGGHLRIELRALPAGPTVTDMLANAAFAIGAAVALADSIDDLMTCLPFSIAQHNFYAAARNGLASALVWPDTRQSQPQEQQVTGIIHSLLPLAEQGLHRLGVEPSDFQPLLALVAARAEAGRNGASWQLQALDRLETRSNRPQALAAMLNAYIDRQREGAPVTEWSLPA